MSEFGDVVPVGVTALKDFLGTVLLRSALGLELYSTSFSEQLLLVFKSC